MDRKTVKARITESEALYEQSMDRLLAHLSPDRSLRLLTVAGPSCSGKTTTTAKLIEGFDRIGRVSRMISIDDFFLEEDDMPRRPDGKPDYEAFESFDLSRLRACIRELLAGRTVKLPRFDFSDGFRSDAFHAVSLPSDGILIVEGLHALNPAVYEGLLPKENVYGIFLNCEVESDGAPYIPRFLRRLVRDNKFRRANASLTFYLWQNVLEGERKYIFPFIPKADAQIDTYFDYEPNVLCTDALRILRELPSDSPYRETADRYIAHLEKIEPIDRAHVPESSLLREFIGYSDSNE